MEQQEILLPRYFSLLGRICHARLKRLFAWPAPAAFYVYRRVQLKVSLFLASRCLGKPFHFTWNTRFDSLPTSSASALPAYHHHCKNHWPYHTATPANNRHPQSSSPLPLCKFIFLEEIIPSLTSLIERDISVPHSMRVIFRISIEKRST